MDAMPSNDLSINVLSYLVDVGSFQPRSTPHAVGARGQETTTKTKSLKTVKNLRPLKSSIKLLNITKPLTHLAHD